MQPTDPSKLTNQQPAGQPAADDHAPMGPPPPETIARGYEADTFDAKSVISVPLLVVLFFVMAFGTVTVIFKFIAYPDVVDPKAHPAAKERNARALNERMAGINRTKDGDQPRLEPLKLRDPGNKAGYDLSRAITRPELPGGNSPEIHPEDLRVTNESYPDLFKKGGDKLPLNAALSLNDAQLKSLFPVQASGAKPLSSQHYPTAANAGRGAEESVVEVPVPPALPTAAKKDAPKAPPENPGGPPKVEVPKVDPKPPEPPKPTEPPKENKK